MHSPGRRARTAPGRRARTAPGRRAAAAAAWFKENETARVMWSMEMLDLSFSMEAFERELHQYTISEVGDAYGWMAALRNTTCGHVIGSRTMGGVG